MYEFGAYEDILNMDFKDTNAIMQTVSGIVFAGSIYGESKAC